MNNTTSGKNSDNSQYLEYRLKKNVVLKVRANNNLNHGSNNTDSGLTLFPNQVAKIDICNKNQMNKGYQMLAKVPEK